MNPAVLAALAAGTLAAGVWLTVMGAVGTRTPVTPGPSRLAAAFGAGLSPRRRRVRRAQLGAALAVTAAVWLLTEWPVAGLIGGAVVSGAPWLLSVGSAERRLIRRLEALETWTRRLKDLVRTGHGLISGIVTSARTVPTGIADEVADLAADLRAGADPQQALDRFGDTLDDFTADQVVAVLKLHAFDRGQRLSDVLSSVAASAASEVAMRRGVAAKRAEPRFVTRFMTCLILIVLVVVFANAAYAKPYGTLVGQLVLFAASLVLVGLLAWIRRLTQPPRRSRFLSTGGTGTGAAMTGRPGSAVTPTRLTGVVTR